MPNLVRYSWQDRKNLKLRFRKILMQKALSYELLPGEILRNLPRKAIVKLYICSMYLLD